MEARSIYDKSNFIFKGRLYEWWKLPSISLIQDFHGVADHRYPYLLEASNFKWTVDIHHLIKEIHGEADGRYPRVDGEASLRKETKSFAITKYPTAWR